MAQTTVSLAASQAFLGGYWPSQGVAGGHTALQGTGGNSDVEGSFNGTSLTLLCYVNSGATVSISIDGATATNPAWTTGAWGYQSVASGLTASLHTYVIKETANSIYLDTTATWQITGGAATMSAPTAPVTQAPWSTGVRLEGGWQSVTASTYAAYFTNFSDAAARITTNSTSLAIWAYQDGAKVRVAVDGVDSATPVVLANTNMWGRIELVTPGSLSNTHTYQVTWCSPSHYCYAFILDTSATTSGAAARTSFFTFGDSITQATPGTSNDSSLGYAHLLAMKLNMQVFNCAIGGTTAANVSGSDTTSGTSRVTADIVSIAPGCVFGVDLYGTNDAGQVKGAETTSVFQSAINTIDTAIINGTTTTKLYELGILPSTTAYNSTIPSFNTAKQAAVTAIGSSRLTYTSTNSWLNTATGLFDIVHPNPSGYATMLPFIKALVSPQVFRRFSFGRTGSRLPQ